MRQHLALLERKPAFLLALSGKPFSESLVSEVRFFEALTGCKLVEGYGLSETSPVASANPPDGPVKEGSIGMPLPATRISIRSLEDPTKELGLGEDGEICISGPQVMPGYWQKPEETKSVFVDAFFRTGDIGHMDEEGFVFIVDRLKDMINCSGFKVYPRRIEEVLYEHPAVEEVIVIGIPNQLLDHYDLTAGANAANIKSFA